MCQKILCALKQASPHQHAPRGGSRRDRERDGGGPAHPRPVRLPQSIHNAKQLSSPSCNPARHHLRGELPSAFSLLLLQHQRKKHGPRDRLPSPCTAWSVHHRSTTAPPPVAPPPARLQARRRRCHHHQPAPNPNPNPNPTRCCTSWSRSPTACQWCGRRCSRATSTSTPWILKTSAPCCTWLSRGTRMPTPSLRSSRYVASCMGTAHKPSSSSKPGR